MTRLTPPGPRLPGTAFAYLSYRIDLLYSLMATHPTVPMPNAGLDNSIPLPPALLRELLEALRSIRMGRSSW
jgi:hypothetical protein